MHNWENGNRELYLRYEKIFKIKAKIENDEGKIRQEKGLVLFFQAKVAFWRGSERNIELYEG